ncbi:MAG: hypothetical protein LC793_15330 [Thermomicrobia bacterium]|nr:hypothetical protein [Thermomicrobia bacterium]
MAGVEWTEAGERRMDIAREEIERSLMNTFQEEHRTDADAFDNWNLIRGAERHVDIHLDHECERIEEWAYQIAERRQEDVAAAHVEAAMRRRGYLDEEDE